MLSQNRSISALRFVDVGATMTHLSIISIISHPVNFDIQREWLLKITCQEQTLRKLLGFQRTEDRFWPDFADIKHDYIQEFYRSYSSFISQYPRTSKFRDVCKNSISILWVQNSLIINRVVTFLSTPETSALWKNTILPPKPEEVEERNVTLLKFYSCMMS